MGIVIPFPRTRDRSFVERHAARIAAARPDTGEKLLAHCLAVQAETMARRGIPGDIIGREMRALEGAIRDAMWRSVLTPGGGAA